jgi:N-acetylglucosaminyl-diphospho-decaprenol L-rhamnosyltransferase
MFTLVVVTHNSAGWLPAFAASWNRMLGATAKEPLPVVVADSGSADDSLTAAENLMTRVQTISCGNVGFGAAANRGIAVADTSWVLLCNPDLVFPVEFLWQFAQTTLLNEQGVGCIAPRLTNGDASVQASAGAWPTLRGIVKDQFRPRELRKYIVPQPTEETRIDWASGACLLLRKEAFDAVGGFDELFFLYVEEVDLLKRMANAGWETWFVPRLSVIHLHPNATRAPRQEIEQYAARGLLRYFAKHAGFFTLSAYRKMAYFSGRLPSAEAFARRSRILRKPAGP